MEDEWRVKDRIEINHIFRGIEDTQSALLIFFPP